MKFRQLIFIFIVFALKASTIEPIDPHSNADIKFYQGILRSGAKSRVLIVIPGLGRSDRLSTVVSNIKHLTKIKNPNLDIQCVIYIYASRLNQDFWSHTEDIKFLSNNCQLIENVEKKVTENIYLVQPVYLRNNFHYVFLLLDDCLIKRSEDFDLLRIIELMQCNQLSVLSPLIIGANKGGGQKFRNIMQTEASTAMINAGITGYRSSFVEIFAWVMTVPAFTALWNLLCPEVNPYAWGYDFWYNGYGKEILGDHHQMGITTKYRLYHEQNVTPSGLGRTDQTSFNDKWNAVLAQERHYLKYHQIKLAYYRKHLDLANTSWNGAVKGYLQSCPT